jgi:hypothetical protein
LSRKLQYFFAGIKEHAQYMPVRFRWKPECDTPPARHESPYDAIIPACFVGSFQWKGWAEAISSIIIDGYNLIGIEHNDLNRQREKLIRLLIEYKKIKGHEITVVFDGWKSGSGKEEQSTTGGVRVIYSRLAEKADAVIKRIISKERKEWIVISSDRRSCPMPGPAVQSPSLHQSSSPYSKGAAYPRRANMIYWKKNTMKTGRGKATPGSPQKKRRLC